MSLGYAEAAKPGVWLLDVVLLGGTTLRVASADVTLTRDDGSTVVYQGGLDDVSLPLVQDGSADISQRFRVHSSLRWATIAAAGIDLEQAQATVRRWHTGQTLEGARVYLRGVISGVSYGARHEPIEFSVERSLGKLARVIPDPQQVIGAETWPVRVGYTLPSRMEGVSYPIVIGRPGEDPSQVVPWPGAPCPMIEWQSATITSRVMLSGHLHYLGGYNVRLYNLSQDGSVNSTNEGTHDDLLGRTSTYADFSGTMPNYEDGDEYWAGYGDGSSSSWARGMKNPYGTEELRGAGDVIKWIMSKFTQIPFDHGEHGSHRDWLNRYKIDTYINQPVNAWEWLENALLAWLPVVPREGPDGVYFLPSRWDYGPDDVSAYLSADRREIERASAVSRLDQPIYNEVTVRYRPARGGGKYYSSRTITAHAGRLSETGADTSDSRILPSYYARRSQATWGVRPLVVEIPHTWHDDTAILVAENIIDRHAWPKRTLRYSGPRDLEALSPGQCIQLTDSEIAIGAALAVVSDVIVADSGVEIDLIILDQPDRFPA